VNSRIELAALDIAGTTVDEGGAVYRVLAEVVRVHGAAPTDADIRAWMGADKREAIAALLAVPRTERVVEQAHSAFVTRLAGEYAAHPPKPLPGVEAALAALRTAGVRVALTTGFDRQVTAPLLAALGWTVSDGTGPATVDAVVCADEVVAGRPAPDLIRAAMGRTGVTEPGAVLAAGDTVLDVRAGLAAGAALVVAVLSGAQTETELRAAGPTHVLPGVGELPELLGLPVAG
jgi:phosphoglycolate phosphatase